VTSPVPRTTAGRLSDRELVLAFTRPRRPSSVRELRLHLTDDVEDTWARVQVERADENLPPPFWAVAWLGGQAVARYVLDHPGDVAGRRVLDLATGSGLCALAARAAGARTVLGVDVDPLAVAATALNAAGNGLEVEVVQVDVLDAPPPEVDVVLAGDVFYDAEMAPRFERWLRRAAATGVRVLVGDPGRHYLPRTGLTELAAYDVPTSRALEGVEVKRVRVFQVVPGG
jgi:predicted nicotinamide N-methyase